MDSPNNIYFANKVPDQLAANLLEKGDSFFNFLRSNAYLTKLIQNWRVYHGAFNSDVSYGHQITFTGEQGELVQLPVNHYRNLAQHMLNMITSIRPVMEPRAINSDYKSLSQTYLAKGILDYYMRDKKLEDYLRVACEMAIVMGSGYVRMEWNGTMGEEYDYDPETDKTMYTGDLQFSNLSPFDVIFDGTKDSFDAQDWLLIRTYKNKYDLAAKYPELAEKILSIPSKYEEYPYRLSIWSNDDTDDVPVFEFYHKKTDAVKDGRYLLFLSPEVVLLDTPMPYRVIPIFRMAPSNILGTPYGYTPMFDIYPLQEGINSLYSAIMTNANAFAVQNVFVKTGSNLTVSQLEGGLNIMEGTEKPEPINLSATSEETFAFLKMLEQTAETISGINSVARGNPESSLKSGAALALVQSMAIQFISGLQNSYVKMIEHTGTALIQNLKDFAKTPRVAAIVGKSKRAELKEFTGDDLVAINRVVVDVGNPLARCLAKDTPILMYDGSIKVVQDIKVGDELMGPDSCIRTVSGVNSGQEMMYEVQSKDLKRKVKYGCNESHILTLKYCSDDYRYDAKKGDIVDITVRDYLKLTSREKRLLQGFKTGVEFNQQNLEIPPYILGAWLGDGHSNCPALTTMDKELVEEWTNYANSLNLKIRIQENRQPNKSKVYFITSGEKGGSSDRNEFVNHLNGLELINNKHIPKKYLTSSRKDRLELLAGLLDTDGSRIDETYIFIQKNDRLTNDVIFLAESLGFRVTYKKQKTNSSVLTGPIDGEVNKVSIGGNTWEIPCRLPRKKCQETLKARDWLNYGIEVIEKGIGTYYGFTLEEEPHFLLGDFTVTHNTISGRVQMAEQMMQMGLIKNPQEYFQVINTGSLDTMFEGDMRELLLIKQENEQMMNGEQPIVSPFDQHRLHFNEHRAVLSDPDLRKDPVLVKNTMDHMQTHIDYLRQTDPGILSLINEQPLPPASGLQPEGGVVPPQPMQQGPQGGGSNAPVLSTPEPLPQVGERINGVQLPNIPNPPQPFEALPTNPADNIPS